MRGECFQPVEHWTALSLGHFKPELWSIWILARLPLAFQPILEPANYDQISLHATIFLISMFWGCDGWTFFFPRHPEIFPLSCKWKFGKVLPGLPKRRSKCEYLQSVRHIHSVRSVKQDIIIVWQHLKQIFSHPFTTKTFLHMKYGICLALETAQFFHWCMSEHQRKPN